MAFEWTRFFDQNRIEYRTSGANVSRGHVAIHCPFCGPQDPSEHLSVHLEGAGWRCFRHPEHRGKSPVRLVQALLGVSAERAREIVGYSVFVPEDFMARVQQQFTPPKVAAARPITLPKEFKAFGTGLPSERPYHNYLLRRKFRERDLEIITKRYGVRYCTSGPFKGRVMFVVRVDGEIVSWTGRSIYPREELRYRALSPDPERAERDNLPIAHGAISHYLLWADRARRGDYHTLVVVEGPMDALKINLLGERHGICAVCFFTSSPTAQQVEELHGLCPHFKRKLLVLDAGTLALGIRVTRDLAGLDLGLGSLPPGVKDPGELDEHTFGDFLLASHLSAT